MDILKTFGKAVIWGVGFGLGVTIAAFLTRTFWMAPSPDHRLDSEQLAAIEVSSQSVSEKDGKLVVTGTVVNGNNAPVQQLAVKSILTEDGKPIEECSTYTTYGKLIQPSERFDFVIFCRNRWSDINLSAIAVQTSVETAYEDFSIGGAED